VKITPNGQICPGMRRKTTRRRRRRRRRRDAPHTCLIGSFLSGDAASTRRIMVTCEMLGLYAAEGGVSVSDGESGATGQ
jgi:hypothetical protein